MEDEALAHPKGETRNEVSQPLIWAYCKGKGL
jgi:hypothetical protein